MLTWRYNCITTKSFVILCITRSSFCSAIRRICNMIYLPWYNSCSSNLLYQTLHYIIHVVIFEIFCKIYEAARERARDREREIGEKEKQEEWKREERERERERKISETYKVVHEWRWKTNLQCQRLPFFSTLHIEVFWEMKYNKIQLRLKLSLRACKFYHVFHVIWLTVFGSP